MLELAIAGSCRSWRMLEKEETLWQATSAWVELSIFAPEESRGPLCSCLASDGSAQEGRGVAFTFHKTEIFFLTKASS